MLMTATINPLLELSEPASKVLKMGGHQIKCLVII
jgi:hypothetical protein